MSSWLRWVFRRRLCFLGLVGALIFGWLSLTPSLLPRPWLFQAAVSGVTAAIGYGLGSALSASIRYYRPREPSGRTKRICWRALAAVAVVGTVLLEWQAHRWNNELRNLMGLEDAAASSMLGLITVTAIVAAIVLVGARLVRSLTRFLIRQLDRVLPRNVTVPIGIAAAAFVVIGFAQGFLFNGAVSAMNRISGLTNGTTDEGAERPDTALRSGGPGSLVDWDDLGRMGRRFTGRGPRQEDIERFHGGDCDCKDPIRVYVGIDSADSIPERARLAVAELDRTGAFDREYLVIFTATGTGWINPRASTGFEYPHQGDTAEVSIQYSFLPSWLSFLVDQRVAAQAGVELIGAVLDRVSDMPLEDRPKILLYGESLGSFGSEEAFRTVGAMRRDVDGALLVGPTFSNHIWTELTDNRVPGSPQWRPETEVEGVLFATTPEDMEGFDPPGSRIVYLQNPSDPITWWNVPLAYARPDWATGPQPPDRSPAFRWIPVVTFWQVAMDLADSLGVPTGHGHHFGSNVIDGWVAISRPEGWTATDTARLKALVGEDGS